MILANPISRRVGTGTASADHTDSHTALCSLCRHEMVGVGFENLRQLHENHEAARSGGGVAALASASV
jgi:hypothetical protein